MLLQYESIAIAKNNVFLHEKWQHKVLRAIYFESRDGNFQNDTL